MFVLNFRKILLKKIGKSNSTILLVVNAISAININVFDTCNICYNTSFKRTFVNYIVYSILKILTNDKRKN